MAADWLEIAFIIFIGFVLLFIWVRGVLVMYFHMRRKHHVKLMRTLKEESQWHE